MPITFESRRKKIQKFLSLPQLSFEKIWYPMLQAWLKAEFEPSHVLYVAIDRTNWGCINLLMISLIWDKRAYPLYWELLPKQGNSNFEKQIAAIGKVLPLFKKYKIVVLGDREFCSVKLGNWFLEQQVYFCLRLKLLGICAARESDLAPVRSFEFISGDDALSERGESD